jgi:hypothetical protein
LLTDSRGIGGVGIVGAGIVGEGTVGVDGDELSLPPQETIELTIKNRKIEYLNTILPPKLPY